MSSAAGGLYLLTSSAVWLGVPQIYSVRFHHTLTDYLTLTLSANLTPIFKTYPTLTIRTYLTLTLTMLLVSFTVWTGLAMLWMHGLSLRYPAPFIGMPGRFCNNVIFTIIIVINRFSGVLSAFFILSRSFPKAWDKEPDFRRQKRFLFAVFMATEGIHMAYFALEVGFAHIPPSYQWILALLLPVMQELFTR